MELRQFIKQSLEDIVAGVAEAQGVVADYGAKVGSTRIYGYTKENKVITDENDMPITQVDFDVALTNTQNQETKGGIGVFLGTVGVGSQGTSEKDMTSLTRVKFRVPIVLPQNE